MDNTINLEQILRSNINGPSYENLQTLIEEYSSPCDILNAMKDACQQILELAAENADLNIHRSNMNDYRDCEYLNNKEYNHGEYDSNGPDYHVTVTINKESILAITNQIK